MVQLHIRGGSIVHVVAADGQETIGDIKVSIICEICQYPIHETFVLYAIKCEISKKKPLDSNLKRPVHYNIISCWFSRLYR